MSQTRVEITIDQGAIQRVAGQVSQRAAYRAASVTRDRARANFTRKGRTGTGKLNRSIAVRDRGITRHGRTYAVGSNLHYAKYQEYGTRAHGPVRAKFLRFKPKGSSTFVFAKWVRGIKPAHALRDAYRALRVSDFLP